MANINKIVRELREAAKRKEQAFKVAHMPESGGADRVFADIAEQAYDELCGERMPTILDALEAARAEIDKIAGAEFDTLDEYLAKYGQPAGEKGNRDICAECGNPLDERYHNGITGSCEG